ncbi:replicative DNA helicase [Telmatospirillum sp. J64-1]|uniref:replicative DNA helicase n=1 Tax=Telmatospirillum sp. J64-1 TaxID=2502183 RepID=UPI00115D1EB4|nr:replicative DNA helicase [Telmatospirillum sp. J64-1]
MSYDRSVPPHSYAAEQAVLGALLSKPDLMDAVVDILRAEHFADPAHADIYAAALHLWQGGKPASVVVLSRHFETVGGLEALGGKDYLAQLVGAVPVLRAATVAEQAAHLVDLWHRRQLIEICRSTESEAYGYRVDGSARELHERHEAALFDLAAAGSGAGELRGFGDCGRDALMQWEAAYKRGDGVIGISTGLPSLDRQIGGLRETDLIILAGRPSMGKTALATCIAWNSAAAGHPVGLFSLEMSGGQVAGRIVSAQARVPLIRALRGEISSDEMARLVAAQDALRELPICVDDRAGLTVPAIRAAARRMVRQRGVKLIVIDYLGLIEAVERNGNKAVEVAEITKGLKGLAKDLNVPVLVLSQLSRAVEAREDKRPMLSDLRDSGSIEQDADVVMFVFREQYYLERSEPSRRSGESDEKYNDRYAAWQSRCDEVWNTGEVIVAKQRQGPVGTVRLAYDAPFTRFRELEGG